jgi:hypothetical protein
MLKKEGKKLHMKIKEYIDLPWGTKKNKRLQKEVLHKDWDQIKAGSAFRASWTNTRCSSPHHKCNHPSPHVRDK